MNPEEAVGLWANIPRVRAGRILHAISFGPGLILPADDIYNLTLLATGDADAADDARCAAIMAEADRRERESG